MFSYAFFLTGFTRSIVQTALITKKILTPSTGLTLYAPISEVVKSYTSNKKADFRCWGVGLIIDNVRNIAPLQGINYESNWTNVGNCRIFRIPANTLLDFTTSPAHTLFALAPTTDELKQLVYRNPKEQFPSWYWKGIACDWLYKPTAEELNRCEPLYDVDEASYPRIHYVGRIKTEKDIAKYLSTKAVKSSHFSCKNEIPYSEPSNTEGLF